MKRTGEPHIWEEELTNFHSLLIDTRRNEIKLIEDHRLSSKTITETLRKWELDHEPTVGDLGIVMAQVPAIIGLEIEV